MEEIKKAMLEDEEEDGEYLDRLRENSGSGLVNTRISDRETEVRIDYQRPDLRFSNPPE
jgi:hypothetical protein